MAREWNARGITLVELMVVLVLIAIISGLVGPPIANRLESLSLHTTATRLAAQFRKAQSEARMVQTPISASYSQGSFHFLKSDKEIGTFSLPAGISPEFENGEAAFLLFPSGQIAGPERFQLINPKGRKAVIELSFLHGVTAVMGKQ